MELQQIINQASESGERAGKFQKNKDQSSATFEREWFVRFKEMYQNTPGLQAGELEWHYKEGYKDGFGVRKPEYFR